MSISRRNFMACGIGLTFVPLQLLAVEEQTPSWKKVCKLWMNVLLPADEYGLGADCAPVWERLLKLMNQDASRAQWIRISFEQLESILLPQTDAQLDSMLKSSSDNAKFLNFLNIILLESYYGSSIGWNDLGLNNPPQPVGFL